MCTFFFDFVENARSTVNRHGRLYCLLVKNMLKIICTLKDKLINKTFCLYRFEWNGSRQSSECIRRVRVRGEQDSVDRNLFLDDVGDIFIWMCFQLEFLFCKFGIHDLVPRPQGLSSGWGRETLGTRLYTHQRNSLGYMHGSATQHIWCIRALLQTTRNSHSKRLERNKRSTHSVVPM